MSKSASRTSNYALIAYPENNQAEKVFGRILYEHIPALVSPLHDKDTDKEGKLKKEHYHVVLKFESLKSVNQVLEIFKEEGIVNVQPLRSVRAYIRYLVHYDDSDKHQYNIDEIVCLCGAEYEDSFAPSKEQIEAIEVQISKAIIEYNITDYPTLVRWCCDKGNSYHSRLARNSYHYLTLIKCQNKLA